ncbi:MAG: MFS transporter [Ignavibacteriaceae bacterium]|nr:MFS transporter [Ignavibacteriaceae bacterium]
MSRIISFFLFIVELNIYFAFNIDNNTNHFTIALFNQFLNCINHQKYFIKTNHVPDARRNSTEKSYILSALMMTMMLAAMDTTIVSTVIPQIVMDLGGFKRFSWVFSIYLLSQTVTIPLYGKLADIFGRKKFCLPELPFF